MAEGDTEGGTLRQMTYALSLMSDLLATWRALGYQEGNDYQAWLYRTLNNWYTLETRRRRLISAGK